MMPQALQLAGTPSNELWGRPVMLRTALTPARAAAAAAPWTVVEMAVMLAGGRVTTSGVVASGGGGAVAALTCRRQATAVSGFRGRRPPVFRVPQGQHLARSCKQPCTLVRSRPVQTDAMHALMLAGNLHMRVEGPRLCSPQHQAAGVSNRGAARQSPRPAAAACLLSAARSSCCQPAAAVG